MIKRCTVNCAYTYGQFLLIDNDKRMVIHACGNTYCKFIFTIWFFWCLSCSLFRMSGYSKSKWVCEVLLGQVREHKLASVTIVRWADIFNGVLLTQHKANTMWYIKNGVHLIPIWNPTFLYTTYHTWPNWERKKRSLTVSSSKGPLICPKSLV